MLNLMDQRACYPISIEFLGVKLRKEGHDLTKEVCLRDCGCRSVKIHLRSELDCLEGNQSAGLGKLTEPEFPEVCKSGNATDVVTHSDVHGCSGNRKGCL